MKNRLLNLVEEHGIKSVAIRKVVEKDKDGNEKEKDILREVDDFEIGDIVDVHQRILEGQKERTQIFNGTVIGRKGEGMREMFIVRRIVQGEGVERVFPMFSPKIIKVEVKRTGEVRRAKLYYLRKRVGKATRLRERKEKGTAETVSKSKKQEAAAAPTD